MVAIQSLIAGMVILFLVSGFLLTCHTPGCRRNGSVGTPSGPLKEGSNLDPRGHGGGAGSSTMKVGPSNGPGRIEYSGDNDKRTES